MAPAAFSLQSASEPATPAFPPPSPQGIEDLSEAVAGLGTVEEVMKYLEPERWQVDMEELYKPTWHVLGKSFIHNKKARGITEGEFITKVGQTIKFEARRFQQNVDLILSLVPSRRS